MHCACVLFVVIEKPDLVCVAEYVRKLVGGMSVGVNENIHPFHPSLRKADAYVARVRVAMNPEDVRYVGNQLVHVASPV